jgi:outer membrane protein assembly factor BamE
MKFTKTLKPVSRVAPRAVVLVVLALAGCASDDPDRSGLFEPYRANLPQGNYVTQEMLRQVKPGMNREQVRFALGSPLLMQTFRTDRWDYVYRFQHANGRADVRRIIIRFADEKVSIIEADQLPVRDDADDPALPGSKAALAAGNRSSIGSEGGPILSKPAPGTPDSRSPDAVPPAQTRPPAETRP